MQDHTSPSHTFALIRLSIALVSWTFVCTMMLMDKGVSYLWFVALCAFAAVDAVVRVDRRIKGKEGGLFLPRYATPIAWTTTVGLVVVLVYMAFRADFKW